MPSCKECRWWRPDVFFVYIGDCNKKPNALDRDNKSCNDFELNKIDAEFLWCTDCRTTVHKSELGKHKKHAIYCEVHMDYDAHEYIKSGD